MTKCACLFVVDHNERATILSVYSNVHLVRLMADKLNHRNGDLSCQLIEMSHIPPSEFRKAIAQKNKTILDEIRAIFGENIYLNRIIRFEVKELPLNVGAY